MYSRITSSRNGKAAISYCESKAHNNNEKRNLIITPVNLLPGVDFADQMNELWKKARRNHTTQVHRVVISFSKKELDPDSEEAWEIANNIVREFIEKYYPNRQVGIYIQNDNKGHTLHAHCIINDCSLNDGKACTKQERYYKYVRDGIDEVASKYIELDQGKPSMGKQSHTEKMKMERADEIRNNNSSCSEDDLRELLIENNAYSYLDDMKRRIKTVMGQASSIKDFVEKLNSFGIEAIKKNSKKYGEYFTYDFFDCPIGVKNSKARSYKLGDEFSPASIEKFIATKVQTSTINNVLQDTNISQIENDISIPDQTTRKKSMIDKKNELIMQIVANNNEMISKLEKTNEDKQLSISKYQRVKDEMSISQSTSKKDKSL